MSSVRSISLVAAGFLLGSLATLVVLSWLGELGQKYAYEPDPRIEPSLRRAGGAAPRELARSSGDRGPQSAARAAAGLPAAPPGPDPKARVPRLESKALEQTPDLEALNQRELVFPVQGADPKSILDTFNEGRGGHRHEATDILAPRGTPVVAIDDGVVRKLFDSKYGGLTVYQFDSDEIYCYYYAHLDRYAEGLREGGFVRRGEKIGYVGTTGNAPPGTPHLHFAIFKLGPEKRWWEGTPINPYPILITIVRRISVISVPTIGEDPTGRGCPNQTSLFRPLASGF